MMSCAKRTRSGRSCAASTTTTPNGRARSGCVPFYRKRQMRCSAAASPSSRCGVRSATRLRLGRWQSPTRRASRLRAWWSPNAAIPTASARPMPSPTTLLTAGIGFRGCGPTRRWSSRPTSRRNRAVPGGRRTQPLTTRRRHPARDHARASKSAHSPSFKATGAQSYWRGRPPPLRSRESELPLPDLSGLGAAADALGQREGHLAAVVVGNELYRHAPSVEPDGVFGAAVNLEFNSRDGRAVDFYRRLLPAADAHLLDLARVGAHHRVGGKEVVRPRVGRMNRRGCGDRALRRGDDKTVAARLAFHFDRAVAFVGHAMKRDETVALPTLGTCCFLAEHLHAQHVDLEVRASLDGCPVLARLDCVAVTADIAKCRVRNLVNELSRRLRHGDAGDRAGGEDTDNRDQHRRALRRH